MKQFSTVFLYELKNTLRNKIFMGFTIVLAVGILLLLFVPPIVSDWMSGDTQNTGDTQELDTIVIADVGGVIYDRDLFIQAFSGQYDISFEDGADKQKLIGLVDSEDAHAAVLTATDGSITYLEKQILGTVTSDLVYSALQNQVQIKIMAESGMSGTQISEAMAPLNFTAEETGRNFMETYWYTYILLILLYMTVNMYGQMVATSVATEKSSRAMELLISSAKPGNLMFGKILGVGLGGLIQLSVWIVSAVAGYLMNLEFWNGIPYISDIFAMPPYVLVYMIVFYVLGYFAFAALYAAVGSLISRVEDINTVSLPLVFLFMVGFFVAIFGMATPDAMLVKVFSYIPIYTPMVMFVRICTTDVPVAGVAVSIVLCVGFTAFACWLASKIYRMGVLMYGNAPKLSTVFKTLRQSKKY